MEVGISLRDQGFQLMGIRLDSGDLGELAVEARKLLDSAGLASTPVVASNDLDEHEIARLNRRGAPIGVWGVGTSIAAAKGQAALGGVYKLALLRDRSGAWVGKAKKSAEPGKATLPGMLQVRRYSDGTVLKGDLIYDELHPPEREWAGSDPALGGAGAKQSFEGCCEDLVRPVLRGGEPVRSEESLVAVRERCRNQLASLPVAVAANNPRTAYPVLAEGELLRRREELFRRTGGSASGSD